MSDQDEGCDDIVGAAARLMASRLIARHNPPQTNIPDDLVRNTTGYSNDQLAIRTLAEVVAQLVMHGPAPDNARRVMLATVADVLTLTEPL